jgi:hypothetical protein
MSEMGSCCVLSHREQGALVADKGCTERRHLDHASSVGSRHDLGEQPRHVRVAVAPNIHSHPTAKPAHSVYPTEMVIAWVSNTQHDIKLACGEAPADSRRLASEHRESTGVS